MFYYFQELLPICILFFFSILLSCFILFLSLRLSPYNPDTEKLSAYECGFDPYGDARNAFDIQFYLIAIIFIIFDLETAFFFPWAVSLSFLSTSGIWCMLDFVIELLVGFAYAWIIGALECE
jgi:NADH-quinone oxidoreductase subunit A